MPNPDEICTCPCSQAPPRKKYEGSLRAKWWYISTIDPDDEEVVNEEDEAAALKNIILFSKLERLVRSGKATLTPSYFRHGPYANALGLGESPVRPDEKLAEEMLCDHLIWQRDREIDLLCLIHGVK